MLTPYRLFPRRETLAEVEAFAASQLPITTQNDLVGLLMLYHNTLLHVQSKDTPNVPSKDAGPDRLP